MILPASDELDPSDPDFFSIKLSILNSAPSLDDLLALTAILYNYYYCCLYYSIYRSYISKPWSDSVGTLR